MQSQEDTSMLHLKNSELSKQVEQLRAEVSQVRSINIQLTTESKKLREQDIKQQNKEQQVINVKLLTTCDIIFNYLSHF